MKICKRCGKNKYLKSFYVAYTYKQNPVYKSECKTCDKKRTIEYRKLNKAQARRASIKYRYDLSDEQLDYIKNNEKLNCEICGNKQSHKIKNNLDIDHCHSTTKFRGLLCNSCNIGLGKFKDNINVLKNAIAYLEKF